MATLLPVLNRKWVWSASLCFVCASSHVHGQSAEAEALREAFFSRYGADLNELEGTFSRTYAHPFEEGKTITQEFQWARRDDAWIYESRTLQPDGIYHESQSWNGDMAVRFSTKAGEDGTGTSQGIYRLNDQAGTLDNANGIEKIIDHIDAAPNGAILKGLDWDASRKALTLGVDTIELQRIHFTDLNAMTYSHIEYFDGQGQVILTKRVDEWTESNGIRYPASGEVRDQLENKPQYSFSIEQLAVGAVSNAEDFIVTIPYEEGVLIDDVRLGRIAEIVELDRELMESKRYFEASEAHHARKMAEEMGANALDDVLAFEPGVTPSGVESATTAISGTRGSVEIHPTEVDESIEPSPSRERLQRFAYLFPIVLVVMGVVLFAINRQRRAKRTSQRQ